MGRAAPDPRPLGSDQDASSFFAWVIPVFRIQPTAVEEMLVGLDRTAGNFFLIEFPTQRKTQQLSSEEAMSSKR